MRYPELLPSTNTASSLGRPSTTNQGLANGKPFVFLAFRQTAHSGPAPNLHTGNAFLQTPDTP